MRQTSPPVTTGRSLPKRAVSASTAWFGAAAPGGGRAGGTAATEGWVNGAGRLGIDAGPDGGARFIAGPEGASGTAAGGTGGGRSLNICAETGTAKAEARRKTAIGATRPRTPRHNPLLCFPQIMTDAFHRKRGKFKPP
jgi:hypothetical protein